MANVTMPTPVALTGGALLLLGGYLLGAVTTSQGTARAMGTVQSYDSESRTLCLSGDDVADMEGVGDDGVLCGVWRRSQGIGTVPEPGEEFRFVSLSAGSAVGPGGERATTVIYGDVVS